MPKCPKCGKILKNKGELIKHTAEAHMEKIPHIGRTRNIV